MGRGVGVELLIGVVIQDESQPLGISLVDGPIDALKEFRTDSIRRCFLGVQRPVDGRPDSRESGLPREVELLSLERLAPLFGGIQSLIEVDAVRQT